MRGSVLAQASQDRFSAAWGWERQAGLGAAEAHFAQEART
jgi:hypothetical protein